MNSLPIPYQYQMTWDQALAYLVKEKVVPMEEAQELRLLLKSAGAHNLPPHLNQTVQLVFLVQTFPPSPLVH